MIGAELKALFEGAAKERQEASRAKPGEPADARAQICAGAPRKSAQDAAKLLNVSRASVQRAATVESKGTPEELPDSARHGHRYGARGLRVPSPVQHAQGSRYSVPILALLEHPEQAIHRGVGQGFQSRPHPLVKLGLGLGEGQTLGRH